MVIDDEPDRRLPHAEIMYVRDRAALCGAALQCRENVLGHRGTYVVARKLLHLQRLDMTFDLDGPAKLLLERVFKIGGNLVGLAVRHAAIELEVEADRAAPTNLLHRDMVDRQSSPRGN